LWRRSVLAVPSAGLSSEPSQVDAKSVEEAVRFRSEFGLPASRAIAHESFENRATYPDDTWGVPLSESEAADLMRRLEVREAVAPAMTYAAELPGYADVFIDQVNGGIPVFMFKGDAEAHRAGLAPRIPAGVDYRLTMVEKSLAELETLRSETDRTTPDLAAIGVQITLTGIDTSRNAVVVGVAEEIDAAATLLHARFGSAIIVRKQAPAVADACTGTANCWPLKGGIRMYWPNNPPAYCTTGWVVKRNGTSTIYLVTAGHCLATVGGVNGADWLHNGNKIGDARTHTWEDFRNADVGLVQVTSVPATKNEVLATLPNWIGQINAVRIPISQKVGDAVCRMGATSGRTCGTLTVWSVRNQSCVGAVCRWIDHTMEMSFDSTGGDSGGSVYQFSPTPGYVIGYGTHVHSDVDGTPGANGWFSAIGDEYATHFEKYGWT
jgi:hypothetical protein